jgi:amylosucrase
VQELGPYLGVGMPARRECHIAYHSSLMAASWASLVREDCTALRQVSAQTPPLPALAAWVTYVRCHDDIVWPVLQTDEAGAAAWLPDELRHVAAFLQGESASSYARGRASFGGGEPGALHGTNGMTAALVGLATASGADEYAAALQRMLLLYGLAMTFGGIPLIYMGDELGQGNDDSEQALRMSRLDSRWIQRPPMDTARLAQHRDPASAAGAVFTSLRSWIGLRQSQPALRADVPATVLSTAHAAVFGLGRGDRFVAYFNFSGQAQLARLPGRARWRDLRSQQSCTGLLPLDPWQMRWLTREPA